VPGLILAFFAIVGIRQSGFNENTGVFLLGMAFFLISGLIAYVSSMDLKVDEHGISKLFFQKQALFLKWSDVKVIKDVEVKSLAGQLTRIFYVIPCASASLSFWSGGWIRFTAYMHDFPTFVNEINKHVRSNNIKIERIRNAEIVICDEIFLRDKPPLKWPGSVS
jgi:hypothetical protein